MAIVSRLADKAQAVTYDFLTGALKPMNVVRTNNGDGWYTTSMTLRALGADATIISAVNSIDELAETCDLFWDDKHRTASVWLEESATSETTKRSLVQSIELTPLQVSWFSTLLNHSGMQYQLTIIHSAAWENTNETKTSTVTYINSVCGGSTDLPAINGSMAARITETVISTVLNTTTNKIWLGIRENLDTTGSTDFFALWEAERATLSGGATKASDSDNASLLGSTDNIVTYTTTTDETKILALNMAQAYGSTTFNSRHLDGDYLVLMRAESSAANTIRAKLTYSYWGSTAEIDCGYVYFSSTDWHFYEMGTISISPFPRLPRTSYSSENFTLRLYVKNTGSAADISIDCFVLVPAAHLLKVTDFTLNATTDFLSVFHEEDDSIFGTVYDATDFIPNFGVSVYPSNWSYPIAGGQLVLVSEDTTGSSIVADENNIGVDIYYAERFRTHGE